MFWAWSVVFWGKFEAVEKLQGFVSKYNPLTLKEDVSFFQCSFDSVRCVLYKAVLLIQ